MRVLLDTNIIIYREDYKTISEEFQKVFNLLTTNKVHLLVHPLAINELKRDKIPNAKRLFYPNSNHIHY